MNKSYKFKNVGKFLFDHFGAELFGRIKNNKLSVVVLGNCIEIHEFFVKCGINSTYFELTKDNLLDVKKDILNGNFDSEIEKYKNSSEYKSLTKRFKK